MKKIKAKREIITIRRIRIIFLKKIVLWMRK